MLRGWSDMPRTLVNCTNGDQRKLTKIGFYVSEACDGQTDFNSLAFFPQDHAMLDLLMREGIAEDCREGETLEPWQRYRKADNPRLTGIQWCVTGLCNLNCRHCYMESPGGRYGELPFDALAGLVEQFERANLIEVCLSGGEPFLRGDILDIIALLAQKKILLYQIYSNGLLIADWHLEGIRQLGFQPAFQISFDGVGAHDQMRGTARSEHVVLDAIRKLRTTGFPVKVATCIDCLNSDSLPDTYELLKGMDIQSWRISAPEKAGNWRKATTELPLERQAEACAQLVERWSKDGRPFLLEFAHFFRGESAPEHAIGPAGRLAHPAASAGGGRPRSRKGEPGAKPDRSLISPEDYACGTCHERLNLLPDGTLMPCAGYVDSVLQDRMPNLLQEELSQVWTRSYLRTIANLKKKDVLAANPDCAACSWFKQCGAGCRAAALIQTGNVMAKEPVTCEVCIKGYNKRFQEMLNVHN